MVTRGTIFYLYVHDMPQSSLVFAVSLPPETPNFGTFGGVAHSPEEFLIFYIYFCFLDVYMHIFEI